MSSGEAVEVAVEVAGEVDGGGGGGGGGGVGGRRRRWWQGRWQWQRRSRLEQGRCQRRWGVGTR